MSRNQLIVTSIGKCNVAVQGGMYEDRTGYCFGQFLVDANFRCLSGCGKEVRLVQD